MARSSARRLLLSVLGAVGVAAPALAQVRPPAVPCPIPCPPAQGVPCPPTTAPGGQPPADPLSPTPSAPAAEATPSFASTQTGAGVGASTAINIMGDLLGSRSIRVGFTRNLRATFPNVGTTAGGVTVIPQTGTVQFSPLAGQGGSTTNLTSLSNLRGINSYFQPPAPGSASITAAQAPTARAIIQSGLSGRPLTPSELLGVDPGVAAQLPAVQGTIAREVTNATRGVGAPNVTVTDVRGTLVGSTLTYDALLTGETLLVLPAAGGVVGRVKMAEDNNPLPRDRVIFNYDYFDNVPFTPAGLPVNRFQFGFEKTFLDGRASIEFRLPFAGTLNSTSVQTQEGTNTELGNLRFAFKYLWNRGDLFNISSGVAVTLPTADDQVVLNSLDPAGTPLYTFRNESVQVEPFVAVLLTPTDRLFAQVWSSVNFDTNGGRLTYDSRVFGGSGSARYYDVPYLSVDGQLAYWLVQNDQGLVRGVAPFIELHWNYAIAQNTLIREVNDQARQNGLTVTSVADNELNLTAGATALLFDNLTVTVGGTAPLLKRPDRTFDAQFGLRVNWYFGRTARDRSPVAFTNTY